MLTRLARLLRPAVLRTQRGPLRVIWWAAHRSMIHAVAASVARGVERADTYLKGGFGFGRPVYGLSDVDMILVTHDSPADRERVQQRWDRLSRRLPPLRELFQVWVYDEADLRALEGATYFTFGLSTAPDGSIPAPAFLGPGPPHDPMALLDHPGLYGPRGEWRRMGGARTPRPASLSPAARAMLAWLELRFIWGFAVLISLDRERASAAYICQKLVSDSARILLWLELGTRLFDRNKVLELAPRVMPEDQETLWRTEQLARALGRRPVAPLADVLPFLVRASNRIAGHLSGVAKDASKTDVWLEWGEASENGGRLPLADWRARTLPTLLDHTFAVLPGNPDDPERLRQVALASTGGFFPTLRSGELLVMPTVEIWHRGRLRGVECPVTDPVSFALADGARVARFPDLPGFSAQDSASRAVAEHAAWLDLPSHARGWLPSWCTLPPCPQLVELTGLFSAARAAFFAASLERSRPELCLTVTAIAGRLADLGPGERAAAEAGLDALRSWHSQGRVPEQSIMDALSEAVTRLPPYAERG